MAALYEYKDGSAYQVTKGGKKVFDMNFLECFLAEADTLELVQQADKWNISISTVKRIRREARMRLQKTSAENIQLREKGKRLYRREYLRDVLKKLRKSSIDEVAGVLGISKGQAKYIIAEAKTDRKVNGRFARSRVDCLSSKDKELAKLKQILYCQMALSYGRSRKSIAQDLGVSVRTVTRYAGMAIR